MKDLLLNIILVLLHKSAGVELDKLSSLLDNPRTHQLATRVLICVDEDSTPKQFSIDNFIKLLKIYPTINIEYHNILKCSEQIQNNHPTILAVITPKPFEQVSDSNIPMYFYDIPYSYTADEYVNAFPNAVSQIKDWRPLKYAFSHFFRSQNWQRILIISDDSPYSAAFERELVEHLDGEGFVYNVQQCYGQPHAFFTWQRCNFTDALYLMRVYKTFVVVANVDAANAASLGRMIRLLGWAWDQYAFLTWDWGAAQALAKVFPNVFSFGLAPATVNLHPELRTKVGPHFSSIGQGVSLIAEAMQEKTERIDLFYRDIFARMNRTINTYKIQAYVQLVTKETVALISVLNLSNCSAVIDYSSDHSFPKVYDLPDCALMRSDLFLSPCYDVAILLFVFVGCAFVITMFLLMYFFNRYLVWT